MDAAIAAYVNRSSGSITLDKDNLSKSIGSGYYSGVTAAFDGTGLNATGAQILTGYTAVTSGGKTPGQMQSGTVSLTLTPSSLTPSTSPNKYVTSASASLDYSSLTAEAANVLQGMTFIGKNGVGSGSLTAASVSTGMGQRSSSRKFTISNLTGTPSNVILMYAASNKPGTVSGIIHRLFYIGGVAYARDVSNYDRAQYVSVSFNHSAHTCEVTFTTTSDSVASFESGRDYRWVVW